MQTKVAISSQDRTNISGHISTCNHFFIYTIDENGQFEKSSIDLNENQILKYSFHEDPNPNPENPLFDMDIILTGSLGQGAVNNLAIRKVAAHQIVETDPDEAIDKLIKGTLQAYRVGDHQHHHGGGCGCGSGGGHHHHEHNHEAHEGCSCHSENNDDENCACSTDGHQEHQCGCQTH